MTRLFWTISWLERQRIRGRLIAMMIVALLLLLSLGQCNDTRNIDLNYQSYKSTGVLSLEIFTNLLELLPLASSYATALIFGLLLIVSIPLKGRSDWENGQFQMMTMGRFNHFMVESTRFLFYAIISVLFLAVLVTITTFFAYQGNEFSKSNILSLQLAVGFWFTTLVPFLLSLGLWGSAIAMAYYRDRQGRALTLGMYFGILCFLHVVLKLGHWIHSQESLLLPKFSIQLVLPPEWMTNPMLDQIKLSPELPLLGLVLSFGLLWWTGRILDEVEA